MMAYTDKYWKLLIPLMKMCTAILSMPVLKIVGLFVNGNKESSMLFVSW